MLGPGDQGTSSLAGSGGGPRSACSLRLECCQPVIHRPHRAAGLPTHSSCAPLGAVPHPRDFTFLRSFEAYGSLLSRFADLCT